jgi:HD-like signal output (HDOD) protein
MTERTHQSTVGNERAVDIAAFVDNIPALPIIVAYVLELTSDDDLALIELAHALEADPGMTTRILRVANSAFYAPPERVFTVRDAIQFIGFEAVRSLAVTTTVVSGMWVDDRLFNRQAFWRHSLRCGLFARRIAEVRNAPTPDVLFTLGVLHDVGRTALFQYSTQRYREILDTMTRDGLLLWKAEQKCLGVDHASVGGMLAEKWRLPSSYAQVIAGHHEPERSPQFQDQARTIALADAMAHAASPRDRQGWITPPLVADLWTPLHLDESTVRGIYDEREFIEQHTRSVYETASLS